MGVDCCEMRRALAPLSALLVFAACEDDRFVAVQPELRVTPESIDFGVVDLGQQKLESILLESVATVPSAIFEVRVEDDCDGCFIVGAPPQTIEPFGSSELEVRFRVRRLEPRRARSPW